MKFTYSSGQRPLDGYTIKRGIGRGGFGEVYYAVSDGGKEVALKHVFGNFEIELRGMSQCLNLKHANLVLLYDLRSDANGEHWVVMEYVAGESLSAILSRHPQGVGVELARQWFLGLAAGVGYLHDHGIVHRDLKPGNIFLENGAVKVGDYGLSKFIGGSQQAPQTQSVGTVHYMAPEISTGNYNRQIDIYAAGILLYEMLTGHVPFDGESVGEILMKHLTTPPDLTKVPSAFVPILDKALCKNAAHRYRTMSEMSRDVTSAGAPPVPLPRDIGETIGNGSVAAKHAPTDSRLSTLGSPTLRGRIAELSTSLVLAAGLAALLTLLVATVTHTADWPGMGKYFFLTVACSWAVLVPAKWWTAPVEDSWVRRLVHMGLGMVIGLGALWLDGFPLESLVGGLAGPAPPRPDGEQYFLGGLFPENQMLPVVACYLSYFGLIFFVMRWWKMAERRRPERISLFAVLATAFWAYIFFFLLPGERERQPFFISLVLAAVVIQVVSPREPPPAPVQRKRLRLRYASASAREGRP